MNGTLDKDLECTCKISGAFKPTVDFQNPNALWQSFEFELVDSTSLRNGAYRLDVIPKDVPDNRLMFITSTLFKQNSANRTYTLCKELNSDEDVIDLVEMLTAMRRDFLIKNRRKSYKLAAKTSPTENNRASTPIEKTPNVHVEAQESNHKDSFQTGSKLVMSGEGSMHFNKSYSSEITYTASSRGPTVISTSKALFPIVRTYRNPKWLDSAWSEQAERAIIEAAKFVEREMNKTGCRPTRSFFSCRFYVKDMRDFNDLVAIVAHQTRYVTFIVVTISGQIYKMKTADALLYDPMIVKKYIDITEEPVESRCRIKYMSCRCLKDVYQIAEQILSSKDRDEVELLINQLKGSGGTKQV